MNLIVFEKYASRRRRMADLFATHVSAEGAKILFFTGVRYIRQVDVELKDKPSTPTRRRRALTLPTPRLGERQAI